MRKLSLIYAAFLLMIAAAPSYAQTAHVHTNWGTGWTMSGSGSGRCTGWTARITDNSNIIVNPDGTQQPDEVDFNCSGGAGSCASVNSEGYVVTYESETIPVIGQETIYVDPNKLPVLLPDQIRTTKNKDNKTN